jgi:hypothetical protein
MIPRFRREVDENCALLGCHAASSGNFLPTFRDKLIGPIWRGQESKKRSSQAYKFCTKYQRKSEITKLQKLQNISTELKIWATYER